MFKILVKIIEAIMALIQEIISRIEALRQFSDEPSQHVKLSVAIKKWEKIIYKLLILVVVGGGVMF